ncbi:hypothetical protein L9F63_006501 [Diploptera punctata]|uniref:Aromatic-L-amino-acid decarboxylase n=1 Tax=Diploptera punctata TaxID=6984 RepID=A0AAD7ZA61_DIPPU|nr:hypothetical protein L9F63_006501 [Diploptera punctata]
MTESRDIAFAWEEIRSQADCVLHGTEEEKAVTYVEKKHLPICNGIKINNAVNGHPQECIGNFTAKSKKNLNISATINTTNNIEKKPNIFNLSKKKNMDAKEFREFGKAAVDYVADYLESLRDRAVLPSVKPGYLINTIPKEAPQHPEKWQEVLKDMDSVFMPGVTHWQSPNFHAYFPCLTSYPSIVGEILSAGINSIGLNWIACPASLELEVAMMNWLGKLLNLPNEFLNSPDGTGGGVIYGSASEAILISLLTAKDRIVKKIQSEYPHFEEGIIKAKLVAYCSDQSNSAAEKAGMLASTIMRILPTDNKCRLRGSALEEAIKTDRKNGLTPFYVLATLGTTGTCAFDDLEELGPICNRENIWFHVDAAYAGTAFACPEFRHLMAGVEYADSFNFNPHKWMFINFDCAAMWLKDSRYLVDAFRVERIFFKNKCEEDKIGLPDYRHWHITLGTRIRALKVWFVLRLYGVEGIQNHVRKQVALAKQFEDLVRNDNRFEIVTEVSMGLVCFRIKGPDSLTKCLHEKLMERKNIYLIAGTFRNKHLLRFVVCSSMTDSKDITFAWEEICSQMPDKQATEEIHSNILRERPLI